MTRHMNHLSIRNSNQRGIITYSVQPHSVPGREREREEEREGGEGRGRKRGRGGYYSVQPHSCCAHGMIMTQNKSC